MTPPHVDWDGLYRETTRPAYSIGEPQPELAAVIEQGKVRSEVLDAGCGHAALSMDLATRGYSVVGLDLSPTAVAAATATATNRGLTTVSFAATDLTEFTGYDGRFHTIMDSGCLHSLPVDRRQSYLESLHRAAAPGARLFILAFSQRAFGGDAEAPGPNGFTDDEIRATAAAVWTVDEVRPATLYALDTHMDRAPASIVDAERDDNGRVMMPGFFLGAHK